MNILVIGASQGTGALAVKEALQRGHNVTAFARSPEKLDVEHPKLKKLQGNFHDRKSVEGAIPGHDAVIITASSTSIKGFKEKPNYFSEGTAYVIDGMKKAGVRRLIVLSALGVGDSRILVPFFLQKLIVDFLLRLPFHDHERQEKQVMSSGLDWVIARPGRLTNGNAKRQYLKKTRIEKVPSSISRADVADFLIEAAATQNWVGKAVQIGG